MFGEETVWLSRNQLADLFGRDVKTIGKHVNNVFSEGELEKSTVVANIATTVSDSKVYQVDHYNLDLIISVGYRVKITARNSIPAMGFLLFLENKNLLKSGAGIALISSCKSKACCSRQ